MKHLPKHLRPRWRYLAVDIECWPDADFDRARLQRHIWYAAQNLVGDAGSAAIDLSVVQFGTVAGGAEAVVRVQRGEVGRGRAVLACLSQVGEDPVGVRVRGVSGTVRACEEKYMGGRPERTDQRRVAFENAQRDADVRDGRVDVHVEDGFAGAASLDI